MKTLLKHVTREKRVTEEMDMLKMHMLVTTGKKTFPLRKEAGKAEGEEKIPIRLHCAGSS